MNSYLLTKSPKNKVELIQRARKLVGQNLAMIAQNFNMKIPANLKQNKGWVGMLLEFYLGANASGTAKRDFADLGIELKTIPIDLKGKPLETTCICTTPLISRTYVTWETSYVRHKLAHVLWIPVEGSSSVPLAKRRIGYPFLWKPTDEEEQKLRKDWEELMDMIVLGQVEKITAYYGEWLQIRPKAANSKILTKAIGEHGEIIMTLPKGFYLRKNFTSMILKKNYYNFLNYRYGIE